MPAQHTAARTKKYLEYLGYDVGKTEQTLFKFTKNRDAVTGKLDSRAEFLKRRDLFGFIDAIAVHKTNPEIVAVQACGATDVTPHVATICNSPIAMNWMKAGGKIRLFAWRKVKIKRGGKAERWRPREFYFMLDNTGKMEAREIFREIFHVVSGDETPEQP